MENYKTFKTQLLASGAAPLEAVIKMTQFPAAAIQVNYNTGSNTVAKLQASVDFHPETGTTPESGHWADVADSSQVLDNGEGTHYWNVTEFIGPWVKVVVDGDAQDCEIWISATRKA